MKIDTYTEIEIITGHVPILYIKGETTMKKVNVNFNVSIPEKHDIENAMLRVADFVEGFCSAVPSKVENVKSEVCKKTATAAGNVKCKTAEKAKQTTEAVKCKTNDAKLKAKALGGATCEAGKLFADAIKSAVCESAKIISASVAAKAAEATEEIVEEINEEIAEACEEQQGDSDDSDDHLSTKKDSDLLNTIKKAKHDILSIKERDPAATTSFEVMMLYSGVHAVMSYRVAHLLHKAGFTLTARGISQFTKFLTGIEIHPGATIGRGLFIDHGSGVVIGETTIIGDNCTVYQGVTLGGTGKQTGKRHPTLGNGVLVGAGAKVLGPVTIGDNSKIAAGAVVLSSIPENSTAVGIPARVVRQNNTKVKELDQVHIPDPVSQEFCRINIRLLAAEKKLSQLTGEN